MFRRRFVAFITPLIAVAFSAPSADAGTLTFYGANGRYAVPDGAAPGYSVGEVRAVTTDPGASVTYTLVSGDGFAVDSATGAITVGVSPSLAAGVVRHIVVRASDGVNSTNSGFDILVSPTSSFATGGVLREKWEGITGTHVSDLIGNAAYAGAPTSTINQNQIEMSLSDRGSDFGMRFTAYLVPPATGTYTFWISSDDSSELWLGSGADKSSIGDAPIASLDGWTGYRTWNASPTQKSSEVNLVKGQIYAIKALYKEGGGNDHLSVAWRGPGMKSPVNGSGATVIQAANLLSPSAFDWTAPAAPRNFTVSAVDSGGVHLAWHSIPDASGIVKYVLYRDGIHFADVGPGSADVVKYVDPDKLGVHSYAVEAIDGMGNVSSRSTLTDVSGAVAYQPLPIALAKGDPRVLTEIDPVLDAAIAQADSEMSVRSTFLNQFFGGLTKVKYKPKLIGGQIFKAASDASERVFPILTATDCAGVSCGNTTRALAVAGTTAAGSRFAAFGDDIFSVSSYGAWPTRTVKWLMTGSGTGTPSSTSQVGILESSSYVTTAKAALIAAGIGNASTIQTCTVATMAACLTGKNLLIVGAGLPGDANADAFKTAIQSAVAAGVPVLYEEDAGYYENSSEKAAKAVLGFEYDGFNYFSDVETKWSDEAAMVTDLVSQTEVAGVKTLLGHFKANDWSIGFSACGDYDCVGAGNRQDYLNANFYRAAKDYMQVRLNKLDAVGANLFDEPSDKDRLLKLMVLLGDLFRRDTRFPLTPTKVPAQDFFKSLYSDYANFQSRLVNPQQPDLGTFSKQLSPSLEHFDVNVTAKSLKDEHTEAAGVYALPGETLTLVRKDDSSTPVKAFINTIQPSSTKEIASYTRPKFLKSVPVTLVQHVPVRITSPYGGPVQISVGAGVPSKAVALQIRNVGRQPVWRTDLDSEEFDAAVAKGDYDWSEIITPAFQAHIRAGRMDQSTADESWNTPSKLASATYRYIFQSSYELAGETGPGLTLSAPVRAICQSNRWNCTDVQTHGISPVINANVDLASCGVWCAGNPYDSSWGLTPASWRDSYAVGLNLKRFLVDGFDTEPSIDLFPTRAAYMWNREHPDQYRGTQSNNGGNLSPWRQDYTYAVMLAARSKSDPIKYVHDVVWGSDVGTPDVPTPSGMAWWAQRLAFYIQLVQQSRVQTDTKFGNGGWDFWTLMYLLDREVDDAKSSADSWLAKKDQLGYSEYSQADVGNLSRNDKLVIEASRVAKLDQRPLFDLWGLTYSAKASGQVATYGFKPAEKNFWYFGTTSSGVPDYFNDALGAVKVDGSVPNLPNLPLNFMWTPNPDNTLAVARTVTLSAALGAPGKVAFKLDGQVLPGCSAVPTVDRHWPNNYVSEKYASCSWIPRKVGESVLTTTLTPTDPARSSSTSVPLAVSIADSPGAPRIEGISRSSATEGSPVTLTGSQFVGVNDVSFNGVKAVYTVNSPTSITVTVPTISPDQSVGRFSVSTDSGYTAYQQEDFTVWRPVAQVTLDKPNIALNRGQVVTVKPTVTPDYATDKSVIWSTSDAGVATVSPEGTVDAIGIGSASITATSSDGAKVAASSVRVVADPVVPALRVVPSLNTIDVDQGASVKPGASVQPANATETTVTWRSLDNSIATADSAGNVTGVAVGNTTLVATSASGAEVSVPVRVNVPVTGDDATNSIAGLSSAIEFTTNNGTTWKKYDGTNLPPLTGNRRLLVRKAGTTTPIKALVFTDGVSSATNPLVTVNPSNTFLSDLVPATIANGWGAMELDSSNGEYATGDGLGISINGVSYARGLGAHANFNAVYALGGKYTTFLADAGADDEKNGTIDFGVFVDGVNKFQSGVIRRSDGAKRVSVNVTGATSLRLTISDGGSNSGDHANWGGAQLVPAVSTVSVTPGAVRLKPGDTSALTANVNAAPGISTAVSWQSSDADVASVSDAGLVTASSVGTATITATSSVGAVVGTALVVVSPPAVTELLLNTNAAAVAGPGSTYQLAAAVRGEVGADTSVIWSSSNPGAATVNSSGLVTGVATGRTTVTASTPDGLFRASARITVGTPTIRIRKLSLDQTTYRLSPRLKLQARLTAAPAKSEGRFVRWRTSDRSVVATDQSGNLTGVAPGTAVVTAISSDGTIAAYATVVVSNSVSSLTLDRTDIALSRRHSTVLTATTLPATAAVRSVTWTSSDPTIASVDPRGKVTARRRGIARITAVANDGGHKVSCSVKVR